MHFPRKTTVHSLIVKEFHQILRNARMRMLLFGSPLIMIVMFGYAVSTDVRMIKTVILDEDRTQTSRSLIGKISASGWFMIQDSIEDAREADVIFERGKADLLVRIPPSFSKDLKTGKGVDVQAVVDGTDSNRASIILSYLDSICSAFSADFLSGSVRTQLRARSSTSVVLLPDIKIEERSLFNPDLESRNFYLPGVVALLIALVSVMLTSMSVVREREEGTMDQVIVSPLRPLEYVIGKTVPFGIVSLIDIIFVTVIAVFWFRVPFNGNILLLLVSGTLYISAMLSVGLFISSVSQTQQQAMLSTFLFFLPAIMLSGFLFPISSMPPAVQLVTYCNPLRYIIVIFRGIFLKGTGISFLWKELLGMTLITVILVMMSVRRFMKTMK